MELGVHLRVMQLGAEALTLRRLEATVDAARDCGFAAVAANDHLRLPDAVARRIDGALWPLGDEPRRIELVAEALR